MLFASALACLMASAAAACELGSDPSSPSCTRFKSVMVARGGPFKLKLADRGDWWHLVPLPGGYIGADGTFYERISFEYHAQNNHYLLPGDSLETQDMEANNSLLDYGRAVCSDLGLSLAGQDKADADRRTKRYSYWYLDRLGMVKHDRRAHRLTSVVGAREIDIRSDISSLSVTGVICD